MISVYNKAIVKELNPSLFELVEKFEELVKLKPSELSSIEIVPAKNQEKTILYKNGDKKVFLHSRYNPRYEAEKMIESCKDLDEGSNLVIYGLGLGYHLFEVVKRFPKIKFYLIEPQIELLYTFLENVELKDFALKNLEGISCDLKETISTIPTFNDKYLGEIKLIWLKGHTLCFPQIFFDFNRIFIRTFRNKAMSTLFFYSHQKRTITNQLDNMKYVLHAAQFLDTDIEKWKCKTALVVAAGPSLDDEYENIRKIKEDKMAYVFAVGSAVNSLLSKGIYADAVFSYDPSIKNQMVLQKIKDEKITDIPLLFGGGIGTETLVDYPGEMLYVRNTDNPILNDHLEQEVETPFTVLGSTITVMALDAVLKLGFNSVILVGQNLGITAEKAYSSGIDYMPEQITLSEQYSETEKNVHGEDMKTSPTYLSMRDGIERVIENYKGKGKIWNSTRKGLLIAGAEYKPLIELMEDMEKGTVNREWTKNCRKTKYKVDHIKEKREEMKALIKDYERQIQRFESILEEIEKNRKLKLYDKLQKLYIKLNMNLQRLEDNKYANTYVFASIIHKYNDVVLGIERFNIIENKDEQAKTIYQEFNDFIKACKEISEEITEKYQRMDKELESYCLEALHENNY